MYQIMVNLSETVLMLKENEVMNFESKNGINTLKISFEIIWCLF